MSRGLTTHALDTVKGGGASGMGVALYRVADEPILLARAVLDAGGRAALTDSLAVGTYELRFAVAAYHRAQGFALTDPPFLDEVAIRFGVCDPDAHYHVPLLVSPYSYSTYRGG